MMPSTRRVSLSTTTSRRTPGTDSRSTTVLQRGEARVAVGGGGVRET